MKRLVIFFFTIVFENALLRYVGSSGYNVDGNGKFIFLELSFVLKTLFFL